RKGAHRTDLIHDVSGNDLHLPGCRRRDNRSAPLVRPVRAACLVPGLRPVGRRRASAAITAAEPALADADEDDEDARDHQDADDAQADDEGRLARLLLLSRPPRPVVVVIVVTARPPGRPRGLVALLAAARTLGDGGLLLLVRDGEAGLALRATDALARC